MAMKLSTGKIAFPITFDNGDKETIFFNPNDPGLSIRLKDFQGKVNERIHNISDIKLKADGSPEDAEVIEEFRAVQNILFEELDYAFGGDISSKVFKHCSPFAVVDGEYFILLFINAITPEIEKELEKANKKVQANMDKHIAKYMK